MPVRNGVLAKSLSAAGGVATLGTAGVTETWLLKSIVVFNNSGAPVLTNVTTYDPVKGVFGGILLQTVAAGGFFEWSGLRNMNPGDQLLWNPAAALQHIWVSGAILPGHL